MFKRFRTGRLGHVFLLCAVMAAPWPSNRSLAQAQEPLRWDGRSPANAQMLIVQADSITRCQDGDDNYFLVRGKAWLSQGTMELRFERGVLRVDSAPRRSVGYYVIDVYAEGDVSFDQGGKKVAPGAAHLQLSTRGDIKLKDTKGPPSEHDFRAAPLFRQAMAHFGKPTVQAPGAVVVPEAPVSARAVPAGGLQLVSAQVPAAEPVPPAPAVPPGLQVQPGLPGQPGELLPQPRAIGGGMGTISAGGNKQVSIRPRSSLQEIQARNIALPSGETAFVVSSGVIIRVDNADGKGGILDIEADRMVMWTRSAPQDLFNDLRTKKKEDRGLEFYMSGNVEVRTQSKLEQRLLRAEEVYYDLNRHVAVATKADMEFKRPNMPFPIHMQSEEILQLNENLFQAAKADIAASALPYNPGLRVHVQDATVETSQVIKKTIFGQPFINLKTGEPEVETLRYFRGKNFFLYVEDIPVFYFPYFQGDAEDPLGPLQNVGVNYNRTFGFQLFTTWDVFDLIGIKKVPGTHWYLNADYLSDRGPALGTDFASAGKDLFNIPGRYTFEAMGYLINDGGVDNLGGGRGQQVLVSNDPPVSVPVTHPEWRGRFTMGLNEQDMPEGFSFLGRLSVLSDRNFLEQYYRNEFFNELNQETYLFLKQQQGSWAWTALAEPRLRSWVTETEWLPRADGYLLGMSLFDTVTWNMHASAGYAQLRPAETLPAPYLATDQRTSTGRFDLWNELNVPFDLGPFRIVPYGQVDLTYYSNDLNGDEVGRVYAAGGVRASIPFSRLYPEVCSDYWNLMGLYHKNVFSANAFVAHSDTSMRGLPQLDRLNDDASDQALRDIYPQQKLLNPAVGSALTTSPLYDPQVYALRRLVDNLVDTRDDIEVVQLGWRQRLQTKRGFPGNEHIIDWMTLDLQMSLFPRANRDNFGQTVSFLEYDWVWNIGDRTSLVSSGLLDPIDNGPRIFTFGANINRPARTNFYLGYRQIDPLQSKSVIGSMTYDFSSKYGITASSNYDFGVKNQATSVVLTRTGSDFRFSFGITHNSILNDVGVVFEIMPIIAGNGVRQPGMGGPYMSSSQGSVR